ncbi:putative TIM-barrel fold metal-dependent hydrolase [Desulfitobacterium dehalogenans ATCC 51507]|uniref:Putative TIM-barrel fold metal-dependent hydrolase n=1 Tax=Desulfitobacterium dehalogenans (strain ATCC 51507 / DSM 9161 / JW/IU-DC1) TaxID=756499 RepID=I4AE51_DESDJ|nr:amidohydrolase [Desulfitobacterium dehalogenans]AFM02236.1 putative TIM-barrel fold metal-dependent hydrolase [Desulfitobacterium dehalogenans ATCC 51507]
MLNKELLLRKLNKLSADQVVINANVMTMNPKQPQAEAIAIKNGKIIGVGSNAEINQFCSLQTEILDLKGKTLLPGFIESHTHMSMYASTLSLVDLFYLNTHSIEDIQTRIKQCAENTPEGTWIVGWGYDCARLAEKRHPNRWDLDKVAPNHPVFVHCFSAGHFGTANSLALEMAGITRDTPSPVGGEIIHDANGEPTGNLAKVPATAMVMKKIPPRTLADLVNGLRKCNEIYLKAGVTSIQEACLGGLDPNELIAYNQVISDNELSVRVTAMTYYELFEMLLSKGADLSELGVCSGCGDDRLKIGPVKIIAGGSLPTQTAALFEPYLGDPSNKGNLLFPQEKLNEVIFKYHKAGFQIAVHAIGDREIESVIEAFESALTRLPRANHRHRIEHCKLATEDQLDRIAKLGLNVTFYPAHTYYFGDQYRDIYLGPKRAARLNPMKSALNRGITFGLHGDSPLTPVSPLGLVCTSVVRETMSGDTQGPEQAISLTEALKAVTINGAYLVFEENIKGSIEIGKLADFVVLSEDPYKIAPRDIKDIQVDLTIIGGEIVYQRF